MNIYVGNFTYQVTENDLKQMFEVFGLVENIKIIKDRFSGRSKGFGFVEMPNNSEADKAIKALNGNMMEKRQLKVIPADSGAKKKKKRFRNRRY
jgi:RNA recognition motif-containing protein